jgi:conjugal transfer pilus assembly protein TraB
MPPQTGQEIPAPAEVKLMSFDTDKGSGPKAAPGLRISRADAPPLIVEDSPDYLPPNSYAPARVVVGVDASAGVASQTDPLPVVLRITGPARSVVQNGRVLTTRLEGCVINGAARGDLSSEKVYVKLARMTCDQPGGRVAVSEVKGFISFAGKSGVRGRVVSREGNLVSQALLAGIVGGFGRGFSANANSVFSTGRPTGEGSAAKLSGSDILGGGLGQGAGDAADTVSKYLIERAEQYQPVVEMPTGIDVEVVFLDGVYVRNSK